MKVGDLVKYRNHARGLGGLVGLVIRTNGEGFDVQWLHHQGAPAHSLTTTEVSEFIEVLHECQTK